MPFCKVCFGTPLPIFANFEILPCAKLRAASVMANHFDNFYTPSDSPCCRDYRKRKKMALASFSGSPESFV